MKTRHILTAMVLPALFAACTADEFAENNSSNLGNRAVLAPITFTVGNDGADTRFGFDEAGNGKWTWESSDAFSAFLVESAGTPEDKLYTNYIYKSADGAKYQTTSQMVEGTYWFYAPAAENKNTRDLLPFKLNTSQNEEYYKSDDAKVFFTALYKLTKDDDPQLNLSLMNYYSRAVFPLTNNTNEELRVRQIILTSKGNPFQVEGNISTAKMAEYMYEFKDGKWVSSKKETVQELKNRLNTADLAIAPTEGEIKTSPSIVLDFGDGVSLAKGASKSFTMLVPRTDKISCDIMIITDKGLINISGTDQSNYAQNVQFKHNGIMPMFGSQSTGAFKAYAIESSKFEDVGDAYYVTSRDDMMKLINTVNGEIKVFSFGDWGVDAAMATAIASSDAYVKFQQPITIADTETISLSNVEFTGGVTIAKGATANFIKAPNGNAFNNVEGDFKIEEGANVTLANGIYYNAEINNAGTLKIGKDATTTSEVIKTTEYTKITSTGELTLENNVNPVITLNGGKLNYTTSKDPQEYAINDKLTIGEGKVEILVGEDVTLNINDSNATFAKDVTIVNNGTLNVDGVTCTINGKLTNAGTIATVNSGAKFIIANKANVTNNANAIIKGVETEISTGGTLNNSGKLEGTTVTNSGTIITASGSRTNITAGTGVINNTAMAFVGGTLDEQTITYEVTSPMNAEGLNSLDVESYKINKLIFKNTLTVDAADMATATAITAIEFAAGSKIDVKAKGAIDFAKVAAVTISSNVTFSGFAGTETITFPTAATVTVNTGCTLTIDVVTVTGASGKTLTFTSVDGGKVVNNGTVQWAAAAYDGTTEGAGWWSGNAANIDDN